MSEGKLELSKRFMNTFVGNGINLIIGENENKFMVHTIEIRQKTDETCPLKHIPVGDYFFRLIAINQNGKEAAILCDWSEKLIKNLLENYKSAQKAGCNEILMLKDPFPGKPNNWILAWGKKETGDSESKISSYIR